MIEIFTDVHMFAHHSLMKGDLESEFKKKIYFQNVFLLGDIVDLKNVKHEEIELAKQKIKELKQITGDRYILGNHECNPLTEMFCIRELEDNRRCMFTHGDYPFWGLERTFEWRSRPHGSSNFKRLISGILNFFRDLFLNPVEVYKEDQKILAKFAKENSCSVIVIGHLHITKLQKYRFDNVEIYACPRGHSKINLNLK